MVKILDTNALVDARNVAVAAGGEGKKKKPKKIGTAWGVIRNPATGAYLLCRRSPTSNNAGQWGFPGGGVDEGETHKQGLLREMDEEIKVKLSASQLHEIIAQQKDVTIIWYEVFQKVSPRKTEEVDMFAWVMPSDFDDYHLHKSVRHYFKVMAGYAKEVHESGDDDAEE